MFSPKVSRMKPNDAPGFWCRLLFTSAATKTTAWQLLRDAVDAAGVEKFGADYHKIAKAGQVRMPLRTDMQDRYPPEFVSFVNLKSPGEFPPTVVGRDAQPLMDQTQLYPGCIIRASVSVYAYGGKGTSFTPGIALGLRNIQRLDDGPRLKGARSGGAEFGALNDDNDLDSLIA